jgi:hypothetical protein
VQVLVSRVPARILQARQANQRHLLALEALRAHPVPPTEAVRLLAVLVVLVPLLMSRFLCASWACWLPALYLVLPYSSRWNSTARVREDKERRNYMEECEGVFTLSDYRSISSRFFFLPRLSLQSTI